MFSDGLLTSHAIGGEESLSPGSSSTPSSTIRSRIAFALTRTSRDTRLAYSSLMICEQSPKDTIPSRMAPLKPLASCMARDETRRGSAEAERKKGDCENASLERILRCAGARAHVRTLMAGCCTICTSNVKGSAACWARGVSDCTM